jgi:hypothetical protein
VAQNGWLHTLFVIVESEMLHNSKVFLSLYSFTYAVNCPLLLYFLDYLRAAFPPSYYLDLELLFDDDQAEIRGAAHDSQLCPWPRIYDWKGRGEDRKASCGREEVRAIV